MSTYIVPLSKKSNPHVDMPLQELAHGSLPQLHTGSIVVVCRLGNDSQIAAKSLREAERDSSRVIVDMIGGLRGWSRDVDENFPVY